MKQYIPKVTEQDVIRISKREFPDDDNDSIMELLNQYSSKKLQRGYHRVRVAALKNANGNIDELRIQIDRAQADYRHVIAPAEYPLYLKKLHHIDKLSEQEQEAIINQDWKQYQEWFNK